MADKIDRSPVGGERQDTNRYGRIAALEAIDLRQIIEGRRQAWILATLHSQILSNLEQAWELTGGSEDQLSGTMLQISQVVARQMKNR